MTSSILKINESPAPLVTVRTVGGRLHHELTQVNSFEDLKDRGSEKLLISVAMVWKMTIGNNDLNPETYLDQIRSSPDKEVVFWTNLDRIMNSLEVELTESLEGNHEAHCIYNFFEMQLRGNLSDSKQDDEEWFEGLTKSKTKSEYMKCKASSRIYKYYQKVRGALGSMDRDSNEVKDVLDKFEKLLQRNEWHKSLFGRTDEDNEGKFQCQGVYNQENCHLHHVINPYRTREGRLQFQLWELDHCIEKSFVIGKLKNAIENAQGRQINTDYFYELFFTTKNLKLVYTACHDRNNRDSFNSSSFDDSQVYQEA